MTLQRRTPLKRSPIKRTVTQLARTAIKRKPPRNESTIEFRGLEREAILWRSGGRCEAQTSVCTGKARTIHHRLMRSHGGKGGRDNGLHVCCACHNFIHAHPALSYENGWLVQGVRAVDKRGG